MAVPAHRAVAPRRARPRRRDVAIAVLAVLAATLSAAALGGGGEAQAATIGLSNGSTLTHWAFPTFEAIVRASPSGRSRAVGRLRFLTGDGQAEPYLALASTQPASPQPASQLASAATWVRIEVPGRPNGEIGWVPRGALGAFHVVRDRLVVDRTRLRATLYRDGRVIFSAPVGVGKPSTVTPAGRFYVMEKLITVGAPSYGPYAIGTSAYAPTLSEWPGGGVVGIHGTNEPQLIPGRPSHGCIRMRNADITRLWRLVSVGTPIEID